MVSCMGDRVLSYFPLSQVRKISLVALVVFCPRPPGAVKRL
jgi:hypothetical protein